MNQERLRIFLSIIWFITKTGQWKTIISVALYALQAKLSYDEYMARLDGSLYDLQVKKAVEDYKGQIQAYKDDVKVDIDGYDKWNKENSL